MEADAEDVNLLDWDLDFSDTDSLPCFISPRRHSLPDHEGLQKFDDVIDSSARTITSPISGQDRASFTNAEVSSDEMIIYESDEDTKHESEDSGQVTIDISERVILRLDTIVLSFLKQLQAGSDQIELMLVNRVKATKNGSIAHRTLRWPKKIKKGSFRRFACLFRVIDLVYEALLTGIPTTKRDIFYKDVHLFKTQSLVDDLVDDLAATIGTTRAAMNVRASSKGLFCGSGLRIHLQRGGIICGNHAEGALIPPGAEISRLEIDDLVSWVLIVEKEAVFQTLCRASFSSSHVCPGLGIIITGKGYPDLATRELVNSLSRTLPDSVPILALVDADAYGLDILSVYKFGSRSLSHEIFTTTPHIIWLGLWGSELSSLGIDRDGLLPLTKHDHKKALDMLRRSDAVMPTQWRKELSHMLHTRRKAEIEIISSALSPLPQLSASQQHRLQNMFQDENVHEVVSPLIQYLVSKLHFWVQSG